MNELPQPLKTAGFRGFKEYHKMDSFAQINQPTVGYEDASFYYPLAHISSIGRKTNIALTSN